MSCLYCRPMATARNSAMITSATLNAAKPLGCMSPQEAAHAIEEFDGRDLDGRPLKVNEAEERRRPSGPPSFDGGGGGGGFGPRPKPKGSRRNLRRKKRSL